MQYASHYAAYPSQVQASPYEAQGYAQGGGGDDDDDDDDDDVVSVCG